MWRLCVAPKQQGEKERGPEILALPGRVTGRPKSSRKGRGSSALWGDVSSTEVTNSFLGEVFTRSLGPFPYLAGNCTQSRPGIETCTYGSF